MGKFRPRRNNYDVALKPYDLSPTIQQMMTLLRRGELYYAVPELRPLWRHAILVACQINNLKRERRQPHARQLWSMYSGLYKAFLDKVREMHENGMAHKLAPMKSFFKRFMNIEPQWLVFHCMGSSGELLHVMV